MSKPKKRKGHPDKEADGILDVLVGSSKKVERVARDGVEEVKVEFRYCHICSAIGLPIQIFQEHCLLFKCPSPACSVLGWGACMKCGPHNKQKVPIENEAQWRKHVRNTHKKTIRKAKDVNWNTTPVEPVQPLASVEEVLPPEADAFPINEDHFSDSLDETGSVLNTNSVGSVIFGQSDGALDRYKDTWLACNARGDDLGFSEKSRSGRYFQQNLLTDSGGMQYLVKRHLLASIMDPTAYLNERFQLPPGHAMLQIQIAELVFGMTPREKEMLVEVMNGSKQIGIENGYAHAQNRISQFFNTWVHSHKLEKTFDKEFIHELEAQDAAQRHHIKNAFDWSTRIPSNVNDIRRLYLEGAHSIVQNLPYPEIKTDIPDHSYVSIIDCIRDFLAHTQGRRMATIDQQITFSAQAIVTHPSMSTRAKEMFLQLACTNEVLKGYVFFWSDDVEPNRLSKSGRGSVWIATMTIGTQLGDGHNFNNTYPIAIGAKGCDHDGIIESVEEEMKLLRTGQLDPFYVGAVGMRVPILISDMAHLSDQPERRGFNYLRLGGRGFTARFGVSANHQQCYEVIRACSSCMSENKNRLHQGGHMLPLPACDGCMNWDVLKEGRLGLAPPPDHYPLLRSETLVSDAPNMYEKSPYCRLVRAQGEQKIIPFRITYESLKGAVTLAHECYCHHGWSSHNVSTYLKVEGLNQEFISRTMEHATRCYALDMARSAQDNPNNECAAYYNTILRDAEQYPHHYQLVPFPPAWNRDGFELRHHPDVIMHLLFLGIVDDSMQLIQNWLKATKRNTAFIKANSGQLEPLIKMDIQWINILRYTGAGFGHWVSENYLGFARLMTWFYQNIQYLEPEVVILPPEEGQKGWNKKHNEHWLKLRGLDASGKADELKNRVEAYMAQTDTPPVIPEPKRNVSDVEDLVVALNKFLECVMSTKVTEESLQKTKYAVRVFLSAYDTLNRSVKGSSTSIFGIFNLACLMNLPEAMEHFGPLRQLWEGATRGEGFLRFVKPMMTQGFKHQSKWHFHLLQKLAIAKAFRNILPQKKKELDSSIGTLTSRKGFFHKHKSLYDFQRDMEANRVANKTPISVILVLAADKRAHIMAVVDSYERVIRITQNVTTTAIKKFGLCYYRFEVEEDYRLVPWDDVATDAVEIGYGLLLPLLADGEENMLFALIASNWKTLSPATPIIDLVDTVSSSFD